MWSSPALERTAMKSAEVRDELIQALRLDLTGPEPGSVHEREELPDEPSRWYIGGFLVPFEASDEQKCDETSNEELFAAGEEMGADDSDAPDRASARKAFLPSSIGLSVLTPPGLEELEAEVTWGDYSLPAVEGEAAAKRVGDTWKREPKRSVLRVAVTGNGARPLPLDLPDSGGLKLVVTARPADGMERLGLAAGTRSVSVFVVNYRKPAPDERKDEAMAFQVRLTVRAPQPFVARPNTTGLEAEDWDERVADLQYRDVVEYVVGHGVSARTLFGSDGGCREVSTEWVPRAAVEKVEPTLMPGVELGMEALAAMKGPDELKAALAPFPLRYAEWIGEQRDEVFAGRRAETAQFLLNDAALACGRITTGIGLLDDPQVLQAFQVANRVMARAARRRQAMLLKVRPEATRAPAWYPFQLAFLLMNLRSVVDPKSADRSAVDLLFFPTGGGKTEAYLGLAAFTMVLRRLRNPGASSAGVSVLMRYTLRLLTLDQLGRVAALVCALELERETNTAELGEWPFEVGLWVGRAATPNRMGSKADGDENTARSKTLRYKKDSKRYPPPIPLESCPWCGEPFLPQSFSLLPNADRPTDLRVVCMNRDCDFTGRRPLPILTVDEPIYQRLPAFLIATVDKFASLPWVGEVGGLFGKAEKELLPPDLIIQDELHLISGPLGTIAGLYEIAIDTLATRFVDGKAIRPKIVASTATIRRAEAQVKALFGRPSVAVFPPPGPDRRDSFFARTVPVSEKEPRTYVGLSAQGRSLKVLLLRAYLALLGASQRMYDEAGGTALGEKNPADPYMSLLGYFTSLRELGGTRRIVEDEVAARAAQRSERLRMGELAGPFRNRQIQQEVVELTSRESTSKVSRARERLAFSHDHKDHVDVALATNMISVGLDIPRLGLMVVLGQPKTTSEYIQATSRVGRDDNRPGLVVTLQNVHRPRDRSHYERFEAYHATFYRAVEATSVTPFSARALDRAAAAVCVALARHGIRELQPPTGAAAMERRRKDAGFVAEAMSQRASGHDPSKSDEDLEALRKRVRSLVDDILDSWAVFAREKREKGVKVAYQKWERGNPANAFPLLRDPLDPDLDLYPEMRKFRAQRAMRDVEPSVGLVLRRLDNRAVPEIEEAEA
ncbi:MAG: helicase [Holophagales bacterium]|nr:helicase [Holophagales bacterium]